MSIQTQALQTVKDYIVANPNVVKSNDYSELRSILIDEYPTLTIEDGYNIDNIIFKTEDDRYWLMDYKCPKVGDIVSSHLVLKTGIFTFTAKEIIQESLYATDTEVETMIEQILTMIKHNPSITMDKLREFSRTFDIVIDSKITFNQAVHVDERIFGISDHCYWSLAYNHPKIGDMIEGDIVNSIGIFTFGTREFDDIKEIKYKRSRSDANDFDVDYDYEYENDDHFYIRNKTRADANDFGVEYDSEYDDNDSVS